MFKFPDAVHRHDWWILSGIAAASLAASLALGFSLPNATPFYYVIPAAATLIPAALAHARGQSRLQVTIITLLVWLFCASLVLGHGCYALAALNFPLQDAAFARFDDAIGLDLVALRTAVGRSEWMSFILQAAYHHTGNQIMLGLVVLFLLRDDFRHLRDTVSVYSLGVLATIILSTILPAIGAYPYLEMHRADPGFLANAGTDGYIAHYTGLRDGTLRAFPTTGWRGIVTFPSFHTIISLVAAYAVLPVRWLFWPSALFSCVVMISTLPVGGHYSIDVIAGLAIFAASVAWVHRRNRLDAAIRPSAPRGHAPELAVSA